MAVRIRWSQASVSDLEEICRFIAKDSDYYARVFAQKIMGIIEAIPSFPEAGRIVPEYRREDLREKIYRNYRIVYRVRSDAIEVVAITHASKPLDNKL
jgi:toxin ParE1/3/4